MGDHRCKIITIPDKVVTRDRLIYLVRVNIKWVSGNGSEHSCYGTINIKHKLRFVSIFINNYMMRVKRNTNINTCCKLKTSTVFQNISIYNKIVMWIMPQMLQFWEILLFNVWHIYQIYFE